MTRTTRAGGRSWFARAILAVALAALSSWSGAALAEARGANASDGRPGSERDCGDLDAAALEELGERTMDRMLGSPEAHRGMDQMMSATQGGGGMAAMHQQLGRRMAGCGGGRTAIGPMMGMMGGMMSGGRGPMMGDGRAASGGGMMGGGGGMMGGGSRGSAPVADRDDDDGVPPAMWVMMLGVLLIGGVIALVVWLRGARSSAASGPPQFDPREVLARRLASGEIDDGEYRRRLTALET